MVADAQKSFQQLDPVGGFSTRPVTILLSFGIVGYAVIATWIGWKGVEQPAVALVAFVALVLASVGAVYWSSPLRAPFPTAGFVLVILLGVIAMVLNAAASWAGTLSLRDEWGPVAIGLTIVQLSPYRPPRQLAEATLAAGIIAGFTAALQPSAVTLGAPPLVVIVECTVPLFALGLASAAFAATLARTLRRSMSVAETAAREATDQLRDGIVRSVQQDRVTILARDVMPFFTELLSRDEITEGDRASAAAIADSIRRIMVADVDRSWLDNVIDQTGRVRARPRWPGSEVVQDDERLAAGMTTEQRTVTRALIVAMFDHPGFDPDGFAILLTRRGSSCLFTLSAKLDNDESMLRSELAGYFAVMRIVFNDLQLIFQSPNLTLRFSYEHK